MAGSRRSLWAHSECSCSAPQSRSTAQCAASLWVEGTQSLESAHQEDQTSAGHRLLQTQSDNCGQITSNADELDKHKVTTMERYQMLMNLKNTK